MLKEIDKQRLFEVQKESNTIFKKINNLEVDMYKVHWIIDGIVNVNKENQEDAEIEVKSRIEKFIEENKEFFNDLGAKAIQGKAYLPGKDEEN